jgi:hypothetical protein
MSLGRKISYSGRFLPSYAWQRLTRASPKGKVHLIFVLADHFEPAIVPNDGHARAPYDEQERRLERWSSEYPKAVADWRDHDGCPFVHTYFYPAEQYDRVLIDRLAKHCKQGWGEVEIHLHHGVGKPDTAENLRHQLVEFRDTLADKHGCLSYEGDSPMPHYAFVHGNFALANSNNGRGCGVDSEMQILSETGCYADMTLPAAAFHAAQTRKINSLYECAMPLYERSPQRKGKDLEAGRTPRIFPLIVQGPLGMDIGRSGRIGIENGAITKSNPASVRRLQLWKRAAICVKGRPDWLFIKLHCHSMDPTQEDVVLGTAMQNFLRELVKEADSRNEVLHFVTAREMVNMIFAACDGREGNPGEYRNYRLKRERSANSSVDDRLSEEVLKG